MRGATGELAPHHSHPGAKQSSVQAMVEDCSGFWMGPLFDFWRPKIWYVSPPSLDHTFTPPPSQLCQQYQGTQFSTIRSPPPHRNARHPIRVHPPQKMHFGQLQKCCQNSDATGLVWQEASLRKFLWRWPLLKPFGLNM